MMIYDYRILKIQRDILDSKQLLSSQVIGSVHIEDNVDRSNKYLLNIEFLPF